MLDSLAMSGHTGFCTRQRPLCFHWRRIRLACHYATEAIGPIRYQGLGRRVDDNATESETGQLRSVVGSLGWIAWQSRPDLSYSVSAGQSAVCNAKIKDLKDANDAVEQAKAYSKAGTYDVSTALSWDNMCIVTVTDASFAQETVIEPTGVEKPHRTQKAFIVLLVDPRIQDHPEAG